MEFCIIQRTPTTRFASLLVLYGLAAAFYLWLYRKPEKLLKRLLYWPVVDLARLFVSRLPPQLQAPIVKSYAAILLMTHKLRGKHRGNRSRSWQERIILAYDTLTPLYRYYHTPTEVSCWFFVNGFSRAILSHWDNPFGFGMVATKHPQKDTPGINFGKDVVQKRSWR